MTLQLVYDGLGVSLHIEEVDAGILAASHCVWGSNQEIIKLEVKRYYRDNNWQMFLDCPMAE